MLSKPERASSTTASATPGSGAAAPPTRFDFGSLSDLFSAFFGDDLLRRGGRSAGRRARGEDVARGGRDRALRRRARAKREVRPHGGACDDLRRERGQPGTPPTRCETCGGAGRLQQISRSVVRRVHPHAGVPDAAAAPADRRASVHDLRRRGPRSRSGRSRSTSPPGSTTASGSASAARATRARPAPGPGTSTSPSTSRRTRSFVREGNDIFSTVELTMVAGGARRDQADRRRSTASPSSSSTPGRSPGETRVLKGRGIRCSRASAAATTACSWRPVPRRLSRRAAAPARGFEATTDGETYERRARASSTSSRALSADPANPVPAVSVSVPPARGGAGRVDRAASPAGSRRRAAGELELAAYTRRRRGRDRASGAVAGGRGRAGRTAGARSTGPCAIGPLWVGPPWEAAPEDAIAVVIDPGPRVRHRRPRDDAALPRAAARGSRGSRCSTSAAAPACSRSPRRSSASARWSRSTAIRCAVEATRENAAANGVEIEAVLADVATDAAPGGASRGREHRAAPSGAAGAAPALPRLVASGYLERRRARAARLRGASGRERRGWAADLSHTSRVSRHGDLLDRLPRLQGVARRRAGGARAAARRRARRTPTAPTSRS